MRTNFPCLHPSPIPVRIRTQRKDPGVAGLFVVTVTAFLAGIINAVAGGGTFLTFPALTYVGGLDQKVANMTSTIGIWPGSAASVAAAAKDFRRIPRSMLIAFSI